MAQESLAVIVHSEGGSHDWWALDNCKSVKSIEKG